MKPIDPNIFDREVTCTYRGETYHICGVNKTSILQSHRGQKNSRLLNIYQTDLPRKTLRKTLENVQWPTGAEVTRVNRHGKKVTKARLVVASNRTEGEGHLKRG